MSSFLKNNIPSWSRWRLLPGILSLTERSVLVILVVTFVLSSLGLSINYYFKNSVIVPVFGGRYREALMGQPQYINPLLVESNEVDKGLNALIFSGLMKYDDNGVLKTDIAEKYTVLDSGKIYIFDIRKDVFWHDGGQLTADDIIFTINILQNTNYKNLLALNWRGVKTEKINDFSVRFSLNNVFAPFLENLTIGILPKHIWESVKPEALQVSEYNLNPIGTGPYKFAGIERNQEKTEIREISLKANEKYYFGRPFISNFALKFYISEDESIKAFNGGDVEGISFLSPKNKSKIYSEKNSVIYQLKMPRYFAVFLNKNKNKALDDIKVRKALTYATDKKQIINQVLDGQADAVSGPILKEILRIDSADEVLDFSLEKAKKELSDWKDNDGDGILDKKFFKTDKEAVKLEINLYTSDSEELKNIAELLKNQWEAIGGIKINVHTSNINELSQKIIRPREFEALLFGEILYMDPDPFSFWHSSQREDPGLNLAMYGDSETDRLLEQARQTLDWRERMEKYDSFQKLIVDDAPAVFLFSPYYLFVAKDEIKGVNVKNIATSAERFANVSKWFIKTDRKLSNK